MLADDETWIEIEQEPVAGGQGLNRVDARQHERVVRRADHRDQAERFERNRRLDAEPVDYRRPLSEQPGHHHR